MKHIEKVAFLDRIQDEWSSLRNPSALEFGSQKYAGHDNPNTENTLSRQREYSKEDLKKDLYVALGGIGGAVGGGLLGGGIGSLIRFKDKYGPYGHSGPGMDTGSLLGGLSGAYLGHRLYGHRISKKRQKERKEK